LINFIQVKLRVDRRCVGIDYSHSCLPSVQCQSRVDINITFVIADCVSGL
jgi:hypothetical protein